MEPTVNVVIEKRNTEYDSKRLKGYILGLRKKKNNKKEQEAEK